LLKVYEASGPPRLNARQPLPQTADADILPLRLAVAAIISPAGTAASYAELARYLGEKLGRPVELVQRRPTARSTTWWLNRRWTWPSSAPAPTSKGTTASGFALS
jgi:hypothetical protein